METELLTLASFFLNTMLFVSVEVEEECASQLQTNTIYLHDTYLSKVYLRLEKIPVPVTLMFYFILFYFIFLFKKIF